MPKMKTNRGAAKRFKKTSKGRFRRAKAGHSHGMINKNRKHNRRLRMGALVAPTDERHVKKLLPYA